MPRPVQLGQRALKQLMLQFRMLPGERVEITARDGDGGGWGVADTPFKTVRVVTTVDFYLD